jgi:LPXTG-motif cell wall-anchored protein
MARLPHTGDHSQWIDLIAFLAVLALGGILMAFGHATVGSLATLCAALGGLYTVWTRRRRPGDSSNAREANNKTGEQSSADDNNPET